MGNKTHLQNRTNLYVHYPSGDATNPQELDTYLDSLNTTLGTKIGGSTGASDNRVLRADGTGGLTLQNTGLTCDDTNNLSGIATLSCTDLSPTNALPVNKGGTAATDAATARTNLGLAYASASDMEAQNSGVVVAPNLQQRHPASPKVWGFVTVSAGTPTLQTSYGVSSIVDTATGRLTINYSVNFSSANYAVIATVGVNNAFCVQVSDGTLAVGSVELRCVNSANTLNDPNSWHFVMFGDQ